MQGILKQYDSSNTMCIASIKPCQSALQNKHYPLNGEDPLQSQNDIFKKKNKFIVNIFCLVWSSMDLKIVGFKIQIVLLSLNLFPSHMPLYII